MRSSPLTMRAFQMTTATALLLLGRAAAAQPPPLMGPARPSMPQAQLAAEPPRKPLLTALEPQPIPPGSLLSIYSTDVGPSRDCVGRADPAHQDPAAFDQSIWPPADPRIFPTELCGVQVLVNEEPAGLLWVGPRQINLKFPSDAPRGIAAVRVVREGVSSDTLHVRVGPPYTEVSLAEPAYVGMPVWVRISAFGKTEGGYPIGPNFVMGAECVQLEVRRDGKLLPRIPEDDRMREHIWAGPLCGSGLPGNPPRPGQFPLHLLYRFDQPGTHEVRINSRLGVSGRFGRPEKDSEWTAIEIQPSQLGQRQRWLAEMAQHAPTDPVAILDDFLPSILGFPDDASLAIVLPYLYHPEEIVRRYTARALGFWPEEQVQREVARLARVRGLSDWAADTLARGARARPDQLRSLMDLAVADLRSEAALRIAGAVMLLRMVGMANLAGERLRVEAALLDSAENVMRHADRQTLSEYPSLLAQSGSTAARDLLWRMIDRGIAIGPAVSALTSRADKADLPKLAQVVESAPVADPLELSGACAALRAAYGSAAVPYLEKITRSAAPERLRMACAEQLIRLNNPVGFEFARDLLTRVVEGSEAQTKHFMIAFLRQLYPEYRSAGEAEILEFVRARAQTRPSGS